MKTVLTIIISFIFITAARAQSLDTVNTYSYGKMPPIYMSNKLYIERHYNKKNESDSPVLQYICLAYNHCRVGNFTSFYPSGKIKETGHYKENITNDWNDLNKRNLCSVQDGEWNEYAEDGTLIRTYFFVDGKIVKENYKDQF